MSSEKEILLLTATSIYTVLIDKMPLYVGNYQDAAKQAVDMARTLINEVNSN